MLCFEFSLESDILVWYKMSHYFRVTFFLWTITSHKHGKVRPPWLVQEGAASVVLHTLIQKSYYRLTCEVRGQLALDRKTYHHAKRHPVFPWRRQPSFCLTLVAVTKMIPALKCDMNKKNSNYDLKLIHYKKNWTLYRTVINGQSWTRC